MSSSNFSQKTNGRIWFVCCFTLHGKQIKFVRLFFGRIYGSTICFWVLSDLYIYQIKNFIIYLRTSLYFFSGWSYGQQQYFRVYPTDVHVGEGGTAVINCAVECTQCSGRVQWTKDGLTLGKPVFYVILYGNVLIFQAIKAWFWAYHYSNVLIIYWFSYDHYNLIKQKMYFRYLY